MKNLSVFLTLALSASMYGQVELDPALRSGNGNSGNTAVNTQASPTAADDAQVVSVALSKYGLVNTDYVVGATIKNTGTNMISSLTFTWSDGTNTYSSTVTDLGLYANQQRVINHTVPLNYAAMTNKTITFTVTAVNGNADSNPANNTATSSFSTVSQLSPKRVVIEEGTGTWCGWCPRGFVAMEAMDAEFPENFLGIAVHMASYDPMIVPAYSSGTGITSFPGMNIERASKGVGVSVDAMRNGVMSRKDLISPAELNASGTLVGTALNFNASATFHANISNANLRLAVVLIEDEVKGNNTNYSQRNYYANNSSGPMGGWESRPDPYPYTLMTYDHVGRMLLGGYNGQPDSVPTSIVDGQVASYNFTATIPATYNPLKMKAVVLLLDGGTGEIVNGRSFLLSTLGTNDTETNKNYLTVYPNPATEYFKVQSNYITDVQIYDAAGKIVLTKTNLAADRSVSVNTLPKGVYMVKISEKGRGTSVKTQKLIIK